MKVRVTLTEDDVEDFAQYLWAHDPSVQPPRTRRVALAGTALGVVLLARGGFLGEKLQEFSGFLALVIVGAIVLGYFQRRTDPRMPDLVEQLEFELVTGPDGLELTRSESPEMLRWREIADWIDADRYFVARLDNEEVLIVPRRCFDTPEEATQFYDHVRSACLRARYHGAA